MREFWLIGRNMEIFRLPFTRQAVSMARTHAVSDGLYGKDRVRRRGDTPYCTHRICVIGKMPVFG